MVDDQRQNCSCCYQNFYSETVQIIADGPLVSYEDQVDVDAAAHNEEDLDGGVVERNEVEEDVDVACEED